MTDPGEILQRRVSELLDIVSRIPGGLSGLTAASGDSVVDLIESAQMVTQSANAILAAGAGELARRSGRGDGSLARQHGWKSAQSMIAAKAGISFGDASRYVQVGEAIRPNIADSGEELRADRPHIAHAMLAGDLILPIAGVIDRTVEQLGTLMERELLDQVEAALVRDFLSGRYSVAAFITKCKELVDQYSPQNAKARDDDLRNKASVRETWLESGMLRIVAELDPEAAAFYKTAMTSRTNPRKPVQGDGNVAALGAHRLLKQPTAAEAKVYAFISIMRDAVRIQNGKQAGVDTTILVRIDHDRLLSGIGSATIDGIATPISASAARRLAAEANLIPQVLNGRSEVLDQGESKRTFTRAQRYAILANHDRCAFPGCDIPSFMLEFHHIEGWDDRGPTDYANGMPLCGWHNRLMENGWDIRYDERRVPWMTPPAGLDPNRAPIRGSSISGRRAA